MIRFYRPMAAALLLGTLAAIALCTAACGQARAAGQVIAPASATLEIEASKGRLVKLSRPASSV